MDYKKNSELCVFRIADNDYGPTLDILLSVTHSFSLNHLYKDTFFVCNYIEIHITHFNNYLLFHFMDVP